MNKRVAVTGHTKGIGEEIFKYFQNKGYSCFGFSRKNGYDVGKKEDRERIIEETKDFDIFVNNACVYHNDSQLYLLEDIYNTWAGIPKIIINVSSRAGDFADGKHPFHNPVYADLKGRQDLFANTNNSLPWIINLKPGTIDTSLTKAREGPKMNVSGVSKILNFVLDSENEFRVRSITFVP